ncbi:MAG: HAD-IA family hydrolase [Candidatus Omnitrophica bacterium]|nr:HAD-IA family hydrolase [Candidatus Omnitrophota bacterium]
MNKIKKTVLSISIITVLILGVRYLSIHPLDVHQARDTLGGFIGRFGLWGGAVYVLIYALNTVTMFPPIALVAFIAGFLFGKVWGGVYLFSGAILGTSVTFFIARGLGRSLIEKLLRGRGKKVDELLRKKGFSTVLFLRLIPVIPYEVLNYLSGLSSMKFRHYFTATLLGSIPWVVAIVYFGEKASQIRDMKDILSGEFLGAAALMLLIAGVPFFYTIVKKMNRKKRAIDVIIFDFDGTLVDSREDIVRSVNHTLRTLGRPEKSREEIVSYIGTGARDLIRQVLENGDDEEIDRGLRIFSEYFRAHSYDHTRLYPGVQETLEHFRNKTLLIVTNRRREMAEGTLQAMGIAHYFRDIVGGDDEHCLKPSGCPVNRALEKSPYPHARCLMVGDMNLDVSSGKGAGILTCAVTYGIGKKEDILLAGPDYIIDTLAELKKIIQ